MAEMQEEDERQHILPKFLESTYELVDNSDTDNLICWTPDGAEFLIYDPRELERTLVSKHFKHCKFDSFIRQLNYYGFKKTSYDCYKFRHELFKKGDKHRLNEIKRKRRSPVIQASLNATSNEEIVRENKWLKRENNSLKQELRRFKSIFRHVSDLMKDLVDDEPVSDVPVESDCEDATK